MDVQRELRAIEKEVEQSRKDLEEVSPFYDQLMAQEEAILKGYVLTILCLQIFLNLYLVPSSSFAYMKCFHGLVQLRLELQCSSLSVLYWT